MPREVMANIDQLETEQHSPQNLYSKNVGLRRYVDKSRTLLEFKLSLLLLCQKYSFLAFTVSGPELSDLVHRHDILVTPYTGGC